MIDHGRRSALYAFSGVGVGTSIVATHHDAPAIKVQEADGSVKNSDIAAGDYWLQPRGALGIDGPPRKVTAVEGDGGRLRLASEASVTIDRQPQGYSCGPTGDDRQGG